MLLQVIRILLDIGVWLLLLSFIFAKYFDKAERKDEDKLSREDVYDIVNKILENRENKSSIEKKKSEVKSENKPQSEESKNENKIDTIKLEHNSGNQNNKKKNKSSKKNNTKNKNNVKNSGVVMAANDVLSKSDRREKIIELSKKGMELAEIAKELKTSIGEVRLVIDLNRNSDK